jgi:hypothetical protein
MLGPITRFVHELSGIEEESRFVATFVGFFSRKLIESLAWVNRGGQRAPFTIPDTLRAGRGA